MDLVLVVSTGKNNQRFGILRRCAATASEHRRCNGISPTLLCLLTQPVGMASKSTTAAKYVYDTLVMVSLGAWKMTFAGNTLAVRLIPILTHLSSRWTVPLTYFYRFCTF
jgi:hypothetical protein